MNNTDFFSTASSGVGDSRRNIKCMISGAVVASYSHSVESTAAAWATARAAQAATIAALQAGGYIGKEPQYNVNTLQAAYQRSIA
ncbi:hypothetical protein [Lacipirellula sp.]|uniref:hypothetical protein n=1 Tax=Lacipirellula sp. TaxID=2691419 RepID=UPI003D103353